MNDDLNLVGKSYTFEDGSTIEVLQIKDRETGIKYVHYTTTLGTYSLPKKLIMRLDEFNDTYRHLFKD